METQDKLLNKGIITTYSEQPVLLLDLLRQYSQKEIIENRLKPKTVLNYVCFLDNINGYLIATGQENITINRVRIKTMETMRLWILQKHSCSLSHASRHVELCKRAMNYAVRMEYIESNPLSPLTAIREKTKEIINLEQREIDLFLISDIQSPMTAKARDLAIMQMFTGMSYADLYSYQVEEINGALWIKNQRAKNATPYYSPFFPEAKAIHDKYNGKLPVLSNLYYNILLKKLVPKLGISKHVTTHTFRKTFATMMDQRGVSPKTIATMLGNTVQVIEKHYVAKSPTRMFNELQHLNINTVSAESETAVKATKKNN